MLVISHHHTAEQLANCSILQHQRQRSFCLRSRSSSVEQLVDRAGLSADENDQPWMTSLYSTSPGMSTEIVAALLYNLLYNLLYSRSTTSRSEWSLVCRNHYADPDRLLEFRQPTYIDPSPSIKVRSHRVPESQNPLVREQRAHDVAIGRTAARAGRRQLPTLKYRRIRGDVIQAFKVITGKYDLQLASATSCP